MEILKFYIKGSGPSSGWLYKHKRLAWMYDRTLRQQLPPLYRFFSLYCLLQKGSSLNKKVKFGEQIFLIITEITKLFHNKDVARLQIDDSIVYIDLLDPRFIQFINEIYNKELDLLIDQFLRKGDTFIDVGANHGSFCIRASKKVGMGGIVVAIEPQPRLAKLITKSLSANRASRFEVHQFACGDKDGKTNFFIPRNTSGAAGLFPQFSASGRYRKISVALRCFDNAIDWAGLPGKILLKVDIEGSELAFFQGAKEMIKMRHPTIISEVNPKSMKASGTKGTSIIRLLNDMEYENYFDLNDLSNKRNIDNLDVNKEHNVIFINKNWEPTKISNIKSPCEY